MRSSKLAPLVVGLMAGGTLHGCAGGGPSRGVALPAFVAAQPFATDAVGAVSTARRPAGRGAATPPPQRELPLAGRLIGALPVGDVWRWAATADTTLLVRRGPQGEVEALVWARAMDTAANETAALAAQRFFNEAAPELASPWLALATAGDPSLIDVVSKAAGQTRLDTALALARLSTPTLGRGLGFRGERDSFSGWRWIGRNASGVELRVGRWSGVLVPYPPLDAATAAVVTALARENAVFADLALATVAPAEETPEPSRRAFMVLGQAGLARADGVQLALVWAETSRAGPEELADLLDSLRAARGSDIVRLSRESDRDLVNLAREARFQLQPERFRVTPRHMRELTSALAKDGRPAQ